MSYDCAGKGYDLIRMGGRFTLVPHVCEKKVCAGGLPFEQAKLAACNRLLGMSSDLKKAKNFEEFLDIEQQHMKNENITDRYKPLKEVNSGN